MLWVHNGTQENNKYGQSSGYMKVNMMDYVCYCFPLRSGMLTKLGNLFHLGICLCMKYR